MSTYYWLFRLHVDFSFCEWWCKYIPPTVLFQYFMYGSRNGILYNIILFLNSGEETILFSKEVHHFIISFVISVEETAISPHLLQHSHLLLLWQKFCKEATT